MKRFVCNIHHSRFNYLHKQAVMLLTHKCCKRIYGWESELRPVNLFCKTIVHMSLKRKIASGLLLLTNIFGKHSIAYFGLHLKCVFAAVNNCSQLQMFVDLLNALANQRCLF